MPLLATLWLLAAAEAPVPAAAKAPLTTVQASTRAFHAQRLQALRQPEGWLSVVGLLWLDEGENRVGAAADNALRCPPGWPAHLGTFTRHGALLTVTPAAGVALTLEGTPFPGGELKVSEDAESARLALGPYRVSALRRGDGHTERIGLRLRDRGAPGRSLLADLPIYPPSAAWQIQARFEPAPAGATLAVQNVLGMISPAPTPGTAVFELAGHTQRLRAVREDDGSLFFIFGDATNGDTTDGAGRFLEAAAPVEGPGGPTVRLDFNQAVNPPCALTRFATCPLPPAGNRLAVRIEAGEKAVPLEPAP